MEQNSSHVSRYIPFVVENKGETLSLRGKKGNLLFAREEHWICLSCNKALGDWRELDTSMDYWNSVYQEAYAKHTSDEYHIMCVVAQERYREDYLFLLDGEARRLNIDVITDGLRQWGKRYSPALWGHREEVISHASKSKWLAEELANAEVLKHGFPVFGVLPTGKKCRLFY